MMDNHLTNEEIVMEEMNLFLSRCYEKINGPEKIYYFAISSLLNVCLKSAPDLDSFDMLVKMCVKRAKLIHEMTKNDG